MGIAAPADWAEADAALTSAILDRARAAGCPVLVALAGAQGSGKSTLAARLAERLSEAGLAAAVLALDDFYLTKAERAELAATIHPLLTTRGVPGTHDLALLTGALDTLLPGGSCAVPRFDKTTDDRMARESWPTVSGPLDVVLLEGWCLGARPQDQAALAAPINALEVTEDPQGHWRRWVNAQLAGPYAALFARFDLAILLKAPDFAAVAPWRAEQERGLSRTAVSAPPMSEAELTRFIAHYERVTRTMLADEPADVVVELDARRRPVAIRQR